MIYPIDLLHLQQLPFTIKFIFPALPFYVLLLVVVSPLLLDSGCPIAGFCTSLALESVRWVAHWSDLTELWPWPLDSLVSAVEVDESLSDSRLPSSTTLAQLEQTDMWISGSAGAALLLVTFFTFSTAQVLQCFKHQLLVWYISITQMSQYPTETNLLPVVRCHLDTFVCQIFCIFSQLSKAHILLTVTTHIPWANTRVPLLLSSLFLEENFQLLIVTRRVSFWSFLLRMTSAIQWLIDSYQVTHR